MRGSSDPRMTTEQPLQFSSEFGASPQPGDELERGRDRVVPIESGERLFALVAAPKRFVRFPDGDHNDLDDHGATATALEFIAGMR